mmetsp:Transcript_17183/g.43623  ORF Transcript_17183/g.43623 Transcript_17183/m.43623 type:complete len:328 (-) Transcript_17183:974-1957(-)
MTPAITVGRSVPPARHRREAPRQACCSAAESTGAPSSGTRRQRQPSSVGSHLERRDLLAYGAVALCSGTLSGVAGAEAIGFPPPPQEGNCFECIGEVGGTLNTCDLDAPSCVSSQNDDEAHFVAPWMYDGFTAKAVEELLAVATGGPYDPMLLDTPFGRSRSDVAGFILQGTVNAVLGRPPPTSRPQAQRQLDYVPFDGMLRDRHTTEDGAEYIRLTFGASEAGADPAKVVDAEFIFPQDDDIVLLRASSRVAPGETSGTLKLSFTDAPLVFDRNYARLLLEQLRKALRFQIVPVITDFDPRFNNDKQLWFEKLLDPANDRYQPADN